jgi:hypothetical protein
MIFENESTSLRSVWVERDTTTEVFRRWVSGSIGDHASEPRPAILRDLAAAFDSTNAQVDLINNAWADEQESSVVEVLQLVPGGLGASAAGALRMIPLWAAPWALAFGVVSLVAYLANAAYDRVVIGQARRRLEDIKLRLEVANAYEAWARNRETTGGRPVPVSPITVGQESVEEFTRASAQLLKRPLAAHVLLSPAAFWRWPSERRAATRKAWAKGYLLVATKHSWFIAVSRAASLAFLSVMVGSCLLGVGIFIVFLDLVWMADSLPDDFSVRNAFAVVAYLAVAAMLVVAGRAALISFDVRVASIRDARRMYNSAATIVEE